jgi:hypothetical protein
MFLISPQKASFNMLWVSVANMLSFKLKLRYSVCSVKSVFDKSQVVIHVTSLHDKSLFNNIIRF